MGVPIGTTWLPDGTIWDPPSIVPRDNSLAPSKSSTCGDARRSDAQQRERAVHLSVHAVPDDRCQRCRPWASAYAFTDAGTSADGTGDGSLTSASPTHAAPIVCHAGAKHCCRQKHCRQHLMDEEMRTGGDRRRQREAADDRLLQSGTSDYRYLRHSTEKARRTCRSRSRSHGRLTLCIRRSRTCRLRSASSTQRYAVADN